MMGAEEKMNRIYGEERYMRGESCFVELATVRRLGDLLFQMSKMYKSHDGYIALIIIALAGRDTPLGSLSDFVWLLMVIVI